MVVLLCLAAVALSIARVTSPHFIVIRAAKEAADSVRHMAAAVTDMSACHRCSSQLCRCRIS